MAYQSTIPAATDQLAVSQGDLQGNFGSVSTYLNVNHVDFNGADQGKHKFITFPVQSVSPTFTATETGLWNEVYDVTTANEIWVHKTTGGPSQEIPWTASILSNNTNPAQGTDGWTFLPSGLIVMWGSINNVTGALTQSVLSGATVPVYNQILWVGLTPSSPSADSTFSVKFRNIVNNTSFNLYVSSLGGYNWMTIGY